MFINIFFLSLHKHWNYNQTGHRRQQVLMLPTYTKHAIRGNAEHKDQLCYAKGIYKDI